MNRKLLLGTSALALVALFIRCTPPTMQDATLSLTAKPRTIQNDGVAASVITVTATDEMSAAGTGTVHLSSGAGSLSGGMDVTLDSNGTGTANFTCGFMTDMGCTGKITVTGTWSHSGKMVTGTVTITAGIPDAGVDAGMDAGFADGGTPDRLVVVPSKGSLVAGTGDSLTLTATLTHRATGAPIPNTEVDFTTSAGSFASAPGTLTAMATTDMNGVASVSLYAADAPVGPATVTATALTGVANVPINMAAVSEIVWQTNMMTATAIGVSYSNRNTSTPVYFKVTDATSKGIGGVDVSFSVSGAAGATVSPTGLTDDGGVAFTTVKSGDSIGIATVTAAVTATQGTANVISASHDVPVVAGKPSGEGFVFDCLRHNIGALHVLSGQVTHNPPLNTVCTATLSDRFGIKVGLPTPVQFYAERGQFDPGMFVTATSGTVGSVSNNYTASWASTPIDDVPPIAGEPVYPPGNRNPRDMLMTVIAVANGEETFIDGSNGMPANGKYDPGEWFIDESEPFIDENDNNQWDPGEFHVDNATDCAHPDGGTSPGWDGPNGCWDSDIQLWQRADVVWTGDLTQPIQFSPPLSALVGRGATNTFNFTWADDYGNPLSPDTAAISATLLPMGFTSGSVTVMTNGINADQLGAINLSHDKVAAQETDAGSGVFNIIGPCTATPPPTNPLMRCIRRISFGPFFSANTGMITIHGATGNLNPDGGPPAVSGSLRVTGGNTLTTPLYQDFPISFQ
jgi:hypothetical protein